MRLSAAILREVPGRALSVTADGVLHVSDRYRIRLSRDWGRSWEVDCTIPVPAWKAALASARLPARLLRHYVAAFRILPDGTRVAVAHDGIYRAGPGEVLMRRVFAITRGSRPLSLTVDPDHRVLFGEYGDNAERHEIHVYVSDPGAHAFHVAYTFPAGEIRHIHNVIHDPHCDRYWVFAGDYDREPGIALLERDFSALEWVARDGQQTRAVGAIVEPGGLVYGTDSEIEQNHLVRLDRASGKRVPLRKVEGSSLYAATFGRFRLISTCVEISRVNPSRTAFLYASADGDRWVPVDRCDKDRWPFKFFQFGLIVLPHSEYTSPRGIYSGQAVRGLDNRVRVADFSAT